MTLYEEFLKTALQGVVVASAGREREARHIAQEAREIADAMWAEVQARPGGLPARQTVDLEAAS